MKSKSEIQKEIGRQELEWDKIEKILDADLLRDMPTWKRQAYKTIQEKHAARIEVLRWTIE